MDAYDGLEFPAGGDEPGCEELFRRGIEDQLVDGGGKDSVDETGGFEETVFLPDWGGGAVGGSGTEETKGEVD